MTNYVQKGITITGEYYWNLLRNLLEEIYKKAMWNAGKRCSFFTATHQLMPLML
jgi:hypothetical protein